MSVRIIFLFSIALLAGCNSSLKETPPTWPPDDQVRVEWRQMDDAVTGDDKRTAIFTVFNDSKDPLPSGWKLYFSQFPTTFYLPADSENKYDLEMVAGDLARLITLDSLPDISPETSASFSYQWPVRMMKNSHGPHGLFFVLPDESVHNVVHFSHQPLPQSLSFETKRGEEPLHITPQKRYELNELTLDISVQDLSPILPTPLLVKKNPGTFRLHTSSKISFDPGLNVEATHLAAGLEEVMPAKFIALQKDGSSADIYLNLDSSSSQISKEGYELTVASQAITITGSHPAGVFYGIQSLKALIPPGFYSVPATEIFLPQITIEDRPRFAYRGQHFDVARNFQQVETIKKMIRLMAFYKLNKLHFHLTDDEGWRLEIPGLPELTEVGAKRGYLPDGSVLPSAYGSGGVADEKSGTGTGFYSREEFIDLLQFATQYHIEVITEINGPGHARAAIKAMEYRYNKLVKEGQESEARRYLLHDRSDQSRYTSAQNYHDNVICVCQENTYAFLEKVISEVAAMYQEAGAPLNLIHTGGDEVPKGAWGESPECQRFIKDEPAIHSVEDLHPYFVRRYLEIARKYQAKIGGWEEITLKATEKGEKPNPEFVGQGVVSYAWNAKVGSGGEDMAYQLANAGYEVVMANASNLYFDLAYNYEPEEPGLFWAGYVDTKNAFELTPSNIFLSVFEDEEGNVLDGLALSKERVPLQPGAEKNIIGIQGALWGEAIKSSNMLEYALLPKMLGLAERAWSAAPAWVNKTTRAELKKSIDEEWTKFANRLGKLELPRLDNTDGGYNYRISPPGAKIEDGTLYINSEYPGLQMRYTTDGSEPDGTSKLYEGPVKIAEDAIVKVRTFTTDNRASRVAILDAKSTLLN